MCTSVARPFDVIIGSQSKHCTEQSRSGPRPDLNGAADASPRTQTCATQSASSGWQKAPQPFWGPSSTGHRCSLMGEHATVSI